MAETDGPKGPNPIANLDVTLSQAASSPPTITVSVTNKNDHPVTIVTYQSPLDKIAIGLGLVTFTPEGASEPLDIPRIMASRMWPPPPECVLEVAPGKSVTQDLVVKKPKVPIEKLGGKATVVMQGTWFGVFPHGKDAVDEDALNDMAGKTFKGDFKSNTLELKIEGTGE